MTRGETGSRPWRPARPVGLQTKVYRVLALSLLALWWGCAAQSYRQPDPPETALLNSDGDLRRLEGDLASLLGRDDPETQLLAQTLLAKTIALAEIYHVQPPALWHNVLVNTGHRQRGLCCHWTEDLLQEIEALRLRSYQAIWGVSRPGTWREHNSVILTTEGKPFSSGLVVDPWRRAGDLFWIRVSEDDYPWQPHPGNARAARIRCR